MEYRVACLSETVRMASRLAPTVAARAPRGASVEPYSLATYLAAAEPPRRVVLCPSGTSVPRDVRFLERAARRLLWPSPPARLADAIGGIRAEEGAGDSPAPPRRGRSRRGRGSALLLEGRVDATRARAALGNPATRDWIVETPGRVRLTDRDLAALAREGVRWAALEPVRVVALCASPALARAARLWRALLPPRTPVWITRRENAASADRAEHSEGRTPRK